MSVRRNPPTVAFLIFVALFATSCNKTKSFRLPKSPDAELAFGVLFDGSNRLASIGAVVSSPTLYSGRYVIRSKDGGLFAKLFFIKLAALEDAANRACAGRPTPADRFACRDRVRSCDASPVSCLAVIAAGDSCGDRLDLPRTLDLRAYQATDKGDLIVIEDPSPLTAQLSLCGPEVKTSCLNRLPGFAVTEHGAFRCAAPARQSGCDLTVDLSDCGFGQARGTLAADGTYRATLASAGCSIGPLSAEESARGNSGFGIACGNLRFIATHMQALFGEVGCAHRGPRVFNEARAEQGHNFGSREVHGSIRGLAAVHPNRWDARYLFVGTGFDECAYDGCTHFGGFEACGSSCTADCNLLAVAQCADTTPWGTCAFGAASPDAGVGSDAGGARDDCLRRCKDSCQAPAFSACLDRSLGHMLAVAGPDRPEREAALVSLDNAASTQRAITGRRGLAVLGEGPTPLILAAGLRAIRVFSTGDRDVLSEVIAARTELDFDVAGITSVPGRSDQVIAYGKSSDIPPKGRAVLLRLSRPPESPLGLLKSLSIPELPGVDELAVGGPNNGWAFLATVSAPLGADGPRRVEVRAIDQLEAPSGIALRGRPTALVGLPGGAVAAGVDLGPGAAGEIALLVPVGPALNMISLPILGRLRVSTMLPDPRSCGAMGAACRVFVGYERPADIAGSGLGLVGLLEFDARDPTASKVIPSFLKTTSAQIDLLAHDGELDQLIAISSSHNQLTQIRLVR